MFGAGRGKNLILRHLAIVRHPRPQKVQSLEQGVDEGGNRAALGEENERAQKDKHQDDRGQPEAFSGPQELPELGDRGLSLHIVLLLKSRAKTETAKRPTHKNPGLFYRFVTSLTKTDFSRGPVAIADAGSYNYIYDQ